MSQLRRVLSCTSCFGSGSIRRLPRRDALHVDGAVARNDDDVDGQTDRSLWDTEARSEGHCESNCLKEHRGRRSRCRVPTFASQQPGESRYVRLFNVGFGDTDTFVRPNHVDDALLPVESDTAFGKGQARKGPHLRLPPVRRAINRNADADDDTFGTALSVPAD